MNSTFQLEKLWLDISTCVQSRYSMPYDSDFLSNVSPLLEANFLHPRRQIKKQTVVLWNATFSHSAPLTYPEELAAVLARVRDKTMISLPGFVAPDAVIEETPLSQFVQVRLPSQSVRTDEASLSVSSYR